MKNSLFNSSHIIWCVSITLFVLTVTTSCCADDDTLPLATQTGKQTLGCYINNGIFVPVDNGKGRPYVLINATTNATTFSISASNGNNRPGRETINISGKDVQAFKRGNFTIGNDEPSAIHAVYTIGGGNIFSGSSTNSIPGQLTITKFDQVNRIIAGTFEFTVLDNDGNEINITDGRFDMRYTN